MKSNYVFEGLLKPLAMRSVKCAINAVKPFLHSYAEFSDE